MTEFEKQVICDDYNLYNAKYCMKLILIVIVPAALCFHITFVYVCFRVLGDLPLSTSNVMINIALAEKEISLSH